MSGEPRKVGRPTKYRQEHNETIRAMLAEGLSLTAAASAIGACRDTVYRWMDEHPRFSDAIKAGRAQGQEVWERRLCNLALTNEGNATATIFAMKNLYRADWNDRTVSEHTGADGGPIKTEEVGKGAAKLADYLDTIAERSGTSGDSPSE